MLNDDQRSRSDTVTLPDEEMRAAMAAADDPTASAAERAEMLMEIARGLQLKPRSPQQLHDAVALYARALALVPVDEALLAARIRALQGTAYQALPDGGADSLDAALDCYESARLDLQALGSIEEVGEIDMNLGLVTQALSNFHRAKLQDAIAHYHRALRVFVRVKHPREFAILHNNLAIAYLAIPSTDPAGKLREALAVQSFEQVLEVVTLVDHPSEYAMIQNNLGNALQYAPSSHPVANLLRAIEAYDEALKVRTPRDTPVEYANTISNKANALRNLPELQNGPPGSERRNAVNARALYVEARGLFERHGMRDNALAVTEVISDMDSTASFGEQIFPSRRELQ